MTAELREGPILLQNFLGDTFHMTCTTWMYLNRFPRIPTTLNVLENCLKKLWNFRKHVANLLTVKKHFFFNPNVVVVVFCFVFFLKKNKTKQNQNIKPWPSRDIECIWMFYFSQFWASVTSTDKPFTPQHSNKNTHVQTDKSLERFAIHTGTYLNDYGSDVKIPRKEENKLMNNSIMLFRN